MKGFSKNTVNLKESIFATMTKLAKKNHAINLSQGFPDFEGPTWIKDLASTALYEKSNQYAPSPGLLELRDVVSYNYKLLYNLSYDSNHEITITNGATEAIFSSLLALLNPGDEVIVFEPYYDSYVATIKLIGATPVAVTLNAPLFTFDRQELSKAFSEKTKVIIINNPHNPSGKIFSQDELEYIYELANRYDAYIVSDEVYEFLTFDNFKHIPMASIKHAKSRTITISSIGKTFGLTGWKIGWTCAPVEVSHAIRMVHQFNSFSVNTPMQFAVADALEKLTDYLPILKNEYQTKRDFFIPGLKKLGFHPINPQGTYFVLCHIRKFSSLPDVGFCLELVETKKVAAIPTSAFYINSNAGSEYIRLCFAKKMTTLQSALERLAND